jgi:hypothetical protein
MCGENRAREQRVMMASKSKGHASRSIRTSGSETSELSLTVGAARGATHHLNCTVGVGDDLFRLFEKDTALFGERYLPAIAGGAPPRSRAQDRQSAH